jgi:hypothetical protein
MSSLLDWLAPHQQLLLWVGAASLIIFTLSLLSLPWLVAQIPEDYFLTKIRPIGDRNILVLWTKNLIGYGLILAGILMLLLPGQGILTTVTGVLLIDYPGKFRLERQIARKPAILKSLNWLRAKAHKPPLIVHR